MRMVILRFSEKNSDESQYHINLQHTNNRQTYSYYPPHSHNSIHPLHQRTIEYRSNRSVSRRLQIPPKLNQAPLNLRSPSRPNFGTYRNVKPTPTPISIQSRVNTTQFNLTDPWQIIKLPRWYPTLDPTKTFIDEEYRDENYYQQQDEYFRDRHQN